MFKTRLLTVTLLLGLGFFLSSSAQDRIITISNDTIDCKINRVSAQYIHFTQFTREVKTKSSISRRDVKSWQVSDAEKSENSFTSNVFQTERWRFSITGGGGYRIASTKESRRNLENQGIPSSEIDSYFKQLKTGVKTAGQIHYMFWENCGLGVDYQFHHSSGSLHGAVDSGDTYTFIYGKFTDNIYTNYVGLSLYMQHRINPKFKFYGQVSSGLTLFREESVIIYTPLLITGKAYGGNSEFGLEYFIGKKISVALCAGFFQSTISKIKVNNGDNIQDIKLEKEQMEGLSRVDLGAGLRFYL
ncbi:hypothetical protein SAMN05444280_11110 [Tangfeifania diversioriginum]|uniref:Outer membrane protein beta-barrel domain-containing protein n=1 Tax=Tangfeifania diversioriginum TaxID=1168035 RepID=A0A1M6GIV7_9BACT|nr:hypothetical protein [Tangfeifania diversioriginum]SHJ09859.1 hypothetical protein SAMN05444280_11110 [Tangfeifania diversioriginum]